MGFVASGRNQIKNTDNVIPDSAQTPTAHTHFLNVANALEARSVLRLTTIGMATTAPESLSPLQDGMLVVTTSAPQEVYLRAASAWVKVHPRIFYGTAAPTASVPANTANGDIYIQYT